VSAICGNQQPGNRDDPTLVNAASALLVNSGAAASMSLNFRAAVCNKEYRITAT
jgi:hypothetical protein